MLKKSIYNNGFCSQDVLLWEKNSLKRKEFKDSSVYFLTKLVNSKKKECEANHIPKS